MLGWAVVFLIIALVAAVLGFGGIAAASAGIAKGLFFIFLLLFVISLIFGWRGRGVPLAASEAEIGLRVPRAKCQRVKRQVLRSLVTDRAARGESILVSGELAEILA